MKVEAFTFEQFHGKRNTGSTQIRVRNLMKYWPELSMYRYGSKPDVLIFQKVYVVKSPQGLYQFPVTYKGGLKILDLCDPDWFQHQNWLKATIDGVDAVTASSQGIVDFVSQLTDKPVRLIKDRFDVKDFPPKKIHSGEAKDIVWFGYMHNAAVLRGVVFHCLKRKLRLTVVSDSDPQMWQVTGDDSFKQYYTFIKYDELAYQKIQGQDICVLPKGSRPEDRFKSDNKTTVARLLGLPVATSPEDLDKFMQADERNKEVDKWYNKTRAEYDVKRSVEEYKALISELSK